MRFPTRTQWNFTPKLIFFCFETKKKEVEAYLDWPFRLWYSLWHIHFINSQRRQNFSLTLLSDVKKSWEIVFNFLWPSQNHMCINFMYILALSSLSEIFVLVAPFFVVCILNYFFLPLIDHVIFWTFCLESFF